MSDNYSFFSIYRAIFQNFPITFYRPRSFFWPSAYHKETKVFRFELESLFLLTVNEVLGWCDHDGLWVLAPTKLTGAHQASYRFSLIYLGKLLKPIVVSNEWIGSNKGNQSNQTYTNLHK